MKAIFWGCRGSLPATYNAELAIDKIKKILNHSLIHGLSEKEQIDSFIENLPFSLKGSYGTNTSCVQIEGGDEIIICDAGSGIRDLGKYLVGLGPKMPKKINLFLSHLHWDHIQGFPFFIPGYFQGVIINIYGCHPNIKDAFVKQQEPPTFPVKLRDMGSEINFIQLDPEQEYTIGGLLIKIIKQPHPGISYGYKFIKDGQTIVYSTDAEHPEELYNDDYPFIEFFKHADILIFDGQFNLADHLYTKQNWGHSSNLIGIELAIRSQVKKLCLFHSEHTFNDYELDKFLKDSKRYKDIYNKKADLDIIIAYDGLTLDLDEI